MSTLRQTEAKFVKLAEKSRKHPAYWKALAELEHAEVLHERNRMRRFLRGVLKGAKQGQTGRDVGRWRNGWASLGVDEVEKALGLPTREDR